MRRPCACCDVRALLVLAAALVLLLLAVHTASTVRLGPQRVHLGGVEAGPVVQVPPSSPRDYGADAAFGTNRRAMARHAWNARRRERDTVFVTADADKQRPSQHAAVERAMAVPGGADEQHPADERATAVPGDDDEGHPTHTHGNAPLTHTPRPADSPDMTTIAPPLVDTPRRTSATTSDEPSAPTSSPGDGSICALCTANGGTCNPHRSTCRCPPTRAGPTCETDLLPACNLGVPANFTDPSVSTPSATINLSYLASWLFWMGDYPAVHAHTPISDIKRKSKNIPLRFLAPLPCACVWQAAALFSRTALRDFPMLPARLPYEQLGVQRVACLKTPSGTTAGDLLSGRFHSDHPNPPLAYVTLFMWLQGQPLSQGILLHPAELTEQRMAEEIEAMPSDAFPVAYHPQDGGMFGTQRDGSTEHADVVWSTEPLEPSEEQLGGLPEVQESDIPEDASSDLVRRDRELYAQYRSGILPRESCPSSCHGAGWCVDAPPFESTLLDGGSEGGGDGRQSLIPGEGAAGPSCRCLSSMTTPSLAELHKARTAGTPLTYLFDCTHPQLDPTTHTAFKDRRALPTVSSMDAYDHWGPDLWADSTRPTNIDLAPARPMPPRCPAKCSGVGACSYGFCSCPLGRWGLGCEFPLASAGGSLAQTFRNTKLRIHVIEAPPLLRRACQPHQLSERFGSGIIANAIATDDPMSADYLLVYGCPEGDSLLGVLRFTLHDPSYREVAGKLVALEHLNAPPDGFSGGLSASRVGNQEEHSAFVEHAAPQLLLVSQFEGGYGNLFLALRHWLSVVPPWIGRWLEPTNPQRIVTSVQLSGSSDYLLQFDKGNLLRDCRTCFNPELDVMVPSPPGEVDGLGLITVNGISCERYTEFHRLCIFERETDDAPALFADGENPPEPSEPVDRMRNRWETLPKHRLFFAGAIHTRTPEPEIIRSRTEPYAHMRDLAGGLTILQTEKVVHQHTVYPDQIDETVNGMEEMARADYCMVPEGKTGNFGHRDVAGIMLGCTPLYTKELISTQFFSRALIPWHAISASIPPHAAPEGKRLLEASYRLFGGATVRKQREIATTKRVWNALTWGSLYPETPCLEDVRDPERDAFGATLLELGRRTRILKVKPEDTACVYVEGTVMPRDEAPRLDGTGLEDGQKHPRFASLRYVTTPEAVPEEVRAREACAPYGETPTPLRPRCEACDVDPFATDRFFVKQCGIPVSKIERYAEFAASTNSSDDDAVTVLLVVIDHNNHGLFAQVERVLNQLYIAQLYNLIPAVWLGPDVFAPIGSCETGANHYHPHHLRPGEASDPNLWSNLFERLSSYDPLDTHILTPGGYRRVRDVHYVRYRDVLEVRTPFSQPPPCGAYHDENGGDFDRRAKQRAACSWLRFSGLRLRDKHQRRVVNELRVWRDRGFRRVLGMHLRGTDKAVRPKVDLQRFKVLAEAWLAHMHAEGGVEGRIGIFVATDDASYREQMLAWFPEHIVNGEAFVRETHNPVRDLASGANKDKAANVLLDALLLAHTDFLLMSTSAVAEFAIWHNPSLHWNSIDLQLPEGRELAAMGEAHARRLPRWAIEALGGESIALEEKAPPPETAAADDADDADEPPDQPPPQVLPVCADGILTPEDEVTVALPEDPSVQCAFPRDAPIFTALRTCPYGYISTSGDPAACDLRLDSALSYLPEPSSYLEAILNERQRRCQAFFLELVAEAARERLATYRREQVRVNEWPPTAPGKAVLRYLLIAYRMLTHDGKFAEVPPTLPWRWAANLTDCDGDTTGTMQPDPRPDSKDVTCGWSCLHETALPHDWRMRAGKARRSERHRMRLALGDGRTDVMCYAHRALSTMANQHRQDEESALLSPYLVTGVLARVLLHPSALVRAFLAERTRRVRHGVGEGKPGPVVALHVRRGDACDRGEVDGALAVSPGPRGHLHTNGVRSSPRLCYAWSVYEAVLRDLKERYGVREVLLATDSPAVLQEATALEDFDWTFVEFDRSSLNHHPEGRSTPEWVEIRADGGIGREEVLSAFAEIHLLGTADIFVGTLSSNFGRLVYHLMGSRPRGASLPPFVTVDGYPLCCDLTQYCETRLAVEERQAVWSACVFGISAAFPLNRTKVPGQVHD